MSTGVGRISNEPAQARRVQVIIETISLLAMTGVAAGALLYSLLVAA